MINNCCEASQEPSDHPVNKGWSFTTTRNSFPSCFPQSKNSRWKKVGFQNTAKTHRSSGNFTPTNPITNYTGIVCKLLEIKLEMFRMFLNKYTNMPHLETSEGIVWSRLQKAQSDCFFHLSIKLRFLLEHVWISGAHFTKIFYDIRLTDRSRSAWKQLFPLRLFSR